MATATDIVTAPNHIAPDTHTGRWTRSRGNSRVDVYTAGELAELGVTVIWKSFGHVYGVEKFARERVVADAAGSLHVYCQDGSKISVYPADRNLRILTK